MSLPAIGPFDLAVVGIYAAVLLLPGGLLAALCGGLAVVETLTAKMRIILAPRLIGDSAAAALHGIVSWLVQT